MKRLLFVFLTAFLSIGMLAACGQGEDMEETEETTGTEETSENEEAAENEETVENEADSDESSDESDTENTETNTQEDTAENEETTESEGSTADETVNETVTLYFSDDQLLETYKEEQEVEAASTEELPEAALNAWLEGSNSEELINPLAGLAEQEVAIQSVEGENGTAEVSFSDAILDVNAGSSVEMAVTDQIALIMEQFGYNETKILVEGQEEPTLFGHMDATEPISAPNPDDYEPVE
ncbi:Sporulation and spore germination [Alteribacillus persepolensis]|uniref:Sporulation and spore germination n=1 Tax=Alteribacillus persepolensis TaxID=568899 RepID=A0A1G8FH51_9BACI|nr:GerMN domain-containing protein [Alteribacillus persepolensis]SDH81473.1 Sporulation and spore germination [Alteribacillus persepolensis]